MTFPNDSSASALRAYRRLEALDNIPAPTSPRRLECDRVSCNHQRENKTKTKRENVSVSERRRE